MKKLDYEASLAFGQPFDPEPGLNLQVPYLEEIARTFRVQWGRIAAMLRLPATMLVLGQLEGEARDAAAAELAAGAPVGTHTDPDNIYRIMVGMRFECVRFPEWFSTAGIGDVERVAHLPGRIAEFGLESAFSFAVMQAWTTYEILATDVWTMALNQRPRGLAATAVEASKAEGGKSIPLTWLHKYDFNFKYAMGNLLRDAKKFKFDALKDIKEAYVAAFGKDAMKTFFEGEPYQELQWLEATRNVFAHRAGEVDERFSHLVKGHPEFGAAPHGSQIVITGKTVSTFANAAIRNGMSLLRYVDGWLADNPD